MGKIPVRDLATKMGIPEQDLLFKLKSIGARIENGSIDTDIIQAILQGKKLAQSPQREVILRDSAEAPVEKPARRTPPPAARRPSGAQRPAPRRRAVVQKAEPKIRTIPSKKRKPTPEEVAAREIAVEEAVKAEEQAQAPPPEGSEPAKSATKEAAAPATPQPAPQVKPAAPKPRATRAAKKATTLPTRKPAPEPTEAPPAESEEERPTRRERRRQAAAEGRTATSEVITISEGMRVRDLAEKLGLKARDVLQSLVSQGVMVTVNAVLEPEVAREVAESLGYQAMVVSFEEEVQLKHEAAAAKQKTTGSEPRAPVVTVMGHVDHGKTSLLDAIRSSRLADAEHGGITQHIAAYQVKDPQDRKVVFLDTPGHEAFTQLRARGAQVTDIVILVVAANDGVMPQTVEAIQHAKAAGVPILVAINKMDRPDANPDRVKKGLSDHDLLVEDWGGNVVAVPVSAIKKEGIDELLEMLQLTAEMLELRADSKLPGQATVIEARKDPGRGIVATVLVQNGTLKQGDSYVAGATWGRVRSMSDDLGNRVKEAGPSTPVEVTGFSDLPGAGDVLQVVEKESQARDIAEHRRQEQRERDLAPMAGRVSLDNLFSQIRAGEVKELPVVLKADVQGSLEVLRDSLEKLSTDKVKVKVIGAGVGAISTNDVLLASASNALVYGFNVRPERNAADLAEKEEVDIRSHTVIYELMDELKKAMAGLLEPEYREVEQGRAEVREIFKIPKIGMIAGCHVVEGSIPRGASVRLLRDNVVIHEGRIGSLRRFKDDASEVRSGLDCGIGIDRFQDLKPGDVIEAYRREEIAPTL